MTKLTSMTNLRLAWRRILTGQNASYREYQTIETAAFAWAEDDNLNQLRNELISYSFEPRESIKIFLPKPSGLLRPITILGIKDTIVYQAIGNIIANQVRAKFSDNYSKLVFSNVLPKYSRSQYFFRDWKRCRKELDSTIKDKFNDGYRWVGKLDLASFYDLVDHRVLRYLLIRLGVNSDVVDFLEKCLSKWTSFPRGFEHGHGIPQGPLVSSLLAECMLNYIDKNMLTLKDSVYLRWVDDIQIMSQSEKDAKYQFARIEILCRQLGLVPTIKSHVRKYSKIDDFMIDEPSNPIAYSEEVLDVPRLDRKENDRVRKIFLDCYKGRRLRAGDDVVTRLRYSLFRMNKDKRLLPKVFYLLNEFSCVFDAVNYYLKKFERDIDVGNGIIKYLDSDPLYQTVRGHILETMFFTCVSGQYNKLRTHALYAIKKSNNVILRCYGAKTLCLRKIYVQPLLRFLSKNDDIYFKENILYYIFGNLKEKQKEDILNKCVRDVNPDIALIAAYIITRDNVRLSKYRKNINPWATPVLSKFGLVKKQQIADRIGQIIKKRYKVKLPASFDFRRVLRASDYKQALMHLNQAEGAFDTQRAFWLVQMDCFNQLILYTIFNRKLHMTITYDNAFSAIHSTRLRARFPDLQTHFLDCHKRRSSSFISHAYSKEKNRYTTDLKVRSRDKLRRSLSTAYQEMVDNY